MATTTRTVGDLSPAPYNPRTITKLQLKMLGQAMAELGDLGGIVYNRRTGHLIGGHQRIKHLKLDAPITIEHTLEEPNAQGTVATGYIEHAGERWKYREVDVDEMTEGAMNVAANKHGGDFDNHRLADLLTELDAGGFPMHLTGFDEQELERFLTWEAEGAEAAADADFLDPPEDEPKSQRGEVYELGRHRLMCGDSTKPDDVAKLMAGDLADCVNTDPPYGVSYESDSLGGIEGDDVQGDALLELLGPALKMAAEFSTDAAAFYIWHASATRRDFEWAIDAAGLEEKQYIIWAKDSFVLGRADYHWQHEPCFYAQHAGHRAPYYGDRKQSTIWRVEVLSRNGLMAAAIANGLRISTGNGQELVVAPRAPKGKKLRLIRLKDAETLLLHGDRHDTDVWQIAHESKTEYQHPTQKPTALAVRAILNSTTVGQIVLDLFGGGGFTLLAAEATGRAARLMELDPRWCDVIRRRYARMVGRPELEP